MVAEDIEVHAIGTSATRATMENIIDATGGTFSSAGSGGSNVETALNNIG